MGWGPLGPLMALSLTNIDRCSPRVLESHQRLEGLLGTKCLAKTTRTPKEETRARDQGQRPVADQAKPSQKRLGVHQVTRPFAAGPRRRRSRSRLIGLRRVTPIPANLVWRKPEAQSAMGNPAAVSGKPKPKPHLSSVCAWFNHRQLPRPQDGTFFSFPGCHRGPRKAPPNQAVLGDRTPSPEAKGAKGA